MLLFADVGLDEIRQSFTQCITITYVTWAIVINASINDIIRVILTPTPIQ